MKEKNFYNEIGNWNFSNINYKTKDLSDWNIYKKIKEYSKKDFICLDLGTGGGEKLIEKYPEVKKVIGIDNSKKMIQTAKANLKRSHKRNIEFKVMDNLKLEYPNESINLISARHTIIKAEELFRILKTGGYAIIEGVDKMDCIELKEIFKRGQAYNDEKSIFEIDLENLKEAGFEVIEAESIKQTEYYQTKEDLIKLLTKTPILNDFSEMTQKNIEKSIERDLLKKYIKSFKETEGIKLNRVSYGIVARKN